MIKEAVAQRPCWSSCTVQDTQIGKKRKQGKLLVRHQLIHIHQLPLHPSCLDTSWDTGEALPRYLLNNSLQELWQSGAGTLLFLFWVNSAIPTGAQEGIAEFILENPDINISTLELLLQANDTGDAFLQESWRGVACQGKCSCPFPSLQQGFWSSLGVQQCREEHCPPDSSGITQELIFAFPIHHSSKPLCLRLENQHLLTTDYFHPNDPW